MSDFSVRSENVDVEQIMRQIRARIREKRGVDYTEEEIRELANVKLEKFIDPKGVRSGLLEEYRRVSTPEPPAPNYSFGEDTLYETHRGPIRWLRSLFRPFLKLLFNPNPLIQALHIQSELNTRNAERAARREQLDALHYEVIHNLVVELTRTGVEVKALKMRLESMSSRLDFDERRARSLEGVVQYRAGAVAPLAPPTGQDQARYDQGRRDQGRRDQGQRNQGGRDQRPRDQGQRPQGPRDQGQRGSPSSFPQSPSPQPTVQQSSFPPAPAPQLPVHEALIPHSTPPLSTGAAPQGTGAQGVPTQGPNEQGFQGNALDADGNERRARRRRRRGRRRPGDRFGGEGSNASVGGTSPSTGDGSAVSPTSTSAVVDQPAYEGEDSPAGPAFRSGMVDEPRSPGDESPVVPTFRSGFEDRPRSADIPDLKVGPTTGGPTEGGTTRDGVVDSDSRKEPVSPEPQRGEGG